MADKFFGGIVDGTPTFTNMGSFADKKGLEEIDPMNFDGTKLGASPGGAKAAADTVFGKGTGTGATTVSARSAFAPQATQAGPTAAGLRQAGANPFVPANLAPPPQQAAPGAVTPTAVPRASLRSSLTNEPITINSLMPKTVG